MTYALLHGNNSPNEIIIGELVDNYNAQKDKPLDMGMSRSDPNIYQS